MPAPRVDEESRLDHAKLLRRAIASAACGRKNGNRPFGALLVDLVANIALEAENTEWAENDATCHAERNLMAKGSKAFNRDELGSLVMCTSTRPYAMCSGGTWFDGTRAVLFGLFGETLSPM